MIAIAREMQCKWPSWHIGISAASYAADRGSNPGLIKKLVQYIYASEFSNKRSTRRKKKRVGLGKSHPRETHHSLKKV